MITKAQVKTILSAVFPEVTFNVRCVGKTRIHPGSVCVEWTGPLSVGTVAATLRALGRFEGFSVGSRSAVCTATGPHSTMLSTYSLETQEALATAEAKCEDALQYGASCQPKGQAMLTWFETFRGVRDVYKRMGKVWQTNGYTVV